jgi:hypothetical protein
MTGKKLRSDWLARIHFGVNTCAFRIACNFVFHIAVADQYYRWNAALAVASFLDSNRHLYVDRNVLELGAGGGLPSIVTVKNGARKVDH